jgi:hypothetical protein
MSAREMIRARIRARMMTRLTLLLGVWLVTSASSSSCSFNSGSGDDDPPVSGSSFSSTLKLRDMAGVETASFVFGEPVRFDFEIVNRTNRQQRLQFPDAQTHDFLVVNDHTIQVRWMWSDGQAFAQANTELLFEPYASKTFTLYWPGTLADGTHLPPGSYQARGTLVFDGFETNPLAPSDLGSELEAFQVR